MSPSSPVADAAEAGHPRDLLRLITCGSVDDGKSTLIGRLLFDTGQVAEDQLAAARSDSRRWGTTGGDLDLALLVDGLQSEREQGITIDVAHRYFQTGRRKFILADTPGHEQYTGNMATAASSADLAVLLVDASHGLQRQTRRHAFIARLLGVRHVIVALNKLDLVQDPAGVAARLADEVRQAMAPLQFAQLPIVPISALNGDNVVRRSALAGYEGPTLLELLEQVDVEAVASDELRFPVQFVSRPDERFRGYAGTLASGEIRVGDVVVALPGGSRAVVRSIANGTGEVALARAGESIMVTLDRQIDLGRGHLLTRPERPALVARRLEADLVWLSSQPLVPGQRCEFKFTHRYVSGRVERVLERIDFDDFSRAAAPMLEANDIGRCSVTLEEAVALDLYEEHRVTGSFLVIDPATRATLAAGMVRSTGAGRLVSIEGRLTPAQRAAQKSQQASVVWFTGLSGAGKSSLAEAVEQVLFQRGHHVFMLDADRVRQGLGSDLGFDGADRRENLRRSAEAARLLAEAGLIVLATFITPLQADRDHVRRLLGDAYVEVFVDAPLDECERRDPKGHYRRARAAQLTRFTGIDSPWEPPAAPDLRIDTQRDDLSTAVRAVMQYLVSTGRVRAAES